MYIVYVIDTSSLRHARVHSAMGDAVREHLAKDTIEGAALDAAKRIQERADALKARIEADPEIGQLTAKLRESHHARPNDNKPGGRDLVGHSSVQAWSAGPIFPAVIARVESYFRMDNDDEEIEEIEDRHYKTEWVLHYPGHRDQTFTAYDGAEARAKELNAQRHAPA